jgi:hypothetical protein
MGSKTLVIAALSLGMGTSSALAQSRNGDVVEFDTPADNDSVLGRQRPEYDAQGVPAGAFRLYPTFGVDWAFDDNVLRTDRGARSDGFFEFSPGLDLRSQWTRHFLRAFASATRYQYLDQSSENRTEWNIGTSGRADIMTGFDLTGALSYLSTFESRTSPDQVGAAEPTPLQRTDARAVLSYNPGRFGVRLGGEYQRYSFDPTKLTRAFGGGEQNNRDRDRDVYSTFATLLYEFSPGYGAFLRPSYEKRVYDISTGRAQGRDSTGYKVDGGVQLLVSQLVSGEVYAGYLNYDFESPRFADVTGVDYGAELRWYPTPLLTVRLNASRTPNATTLAGASASDDRSVALGADYEVLRNIILQGDLAYTDAVFQGITRRDEDISAILGLRYLVNPYLSARAQFIRTVRSSSVTGRGFDDDVISIGVTGQL